MIGTAMLFISSKKTLIRLLLSAVISLSGISVIQTSQASVILQVQDSKKISLARQLINMDGSKQGSEQANQVGIETMRRNMPTVPNEFFVRLSKKLNAYDHETRLANLYAQVLSVDELNALVDLYSSPTGKSLASKMGILSERLAYQQNQIVETIVQQTMNEMGVLTQ